MTKTYSLMWCYVCGRELSSNGLAKTNHYKKHVREGKMVALRSAYFNYTRYEIAKGVEILPPGPRKPRPAP
jgi:hypothetical protein